MEDNLYEELKSVLKNDFKYEIIQSGFSTDKKYKILCSKEVYLLRISDINLYENRSTEFKIMKSLAEIRVKYNKPIHINKLVKNNSAICYSLFSFIEGTDAEKTLTNYTNEMQYKIGFEAGIDLKKINSLKSTDKNEGAGLLFLTQ